MTDFELLQDYLDNASQASFSQLVSRYVKLVYSAALRQTRDAHLAEDVSQAVFLILSQKARTIKPTTILPAWLYKTTRYAAANAMRLKNIRHKRELKASEMTPMHTQSATDADDGLGELEPLLDLAVARLGNTDRQVVVLHYFQGSSLSEVGTMLGLTPDAARKRLQRAIVKLRSFFSRHGSEVSAVTLSHLLIRTHQQAIIPTHLSSSITSAVSSSATSTLSSTIAQGALHMMFITKLKCATAVAASVLLISASSIIVVLQTTAQAAAPTAAKAAAPAALPDTPLKALRELARAIREGDALTVEQLIHGTTPAEKRVIKAQANLCTAVYKLRKAYGEAYGKAELAKLPPMVGPTNVPPGTKEKIEGDTATIEMPGAPIPLGMVRAEGTWKLPYSFLASSGLPLPPDRLADWQEKMPAVFDEITEGITIGQFKKPMDAMIALQKRVKELAQSAMTAPTTTTPAPAPAPAPSN